MTMAYTKQTWATGDTVTAEKLNHIEDGVSDAGIAPSPASSGTPEMDGTAARGSSAQYARADHVHPTDTSRLAANQGSGNAGRFMVVGSDGVVTPVAMSAWSGGSY